MTKTERIIKMLTEQGHIEVASSSNKYRKFIRAGALKEQYFWVGRSAGLRLGRTSTASHSLDADKLLARHDASKLLTEALTGIIPDEGKDG